ncbi:MAG: hypothetical protein MZU95_12040 [Desulfomicrobium escambiense]|nr:hypothetical protein [Desulfomicrobium escambiense]
MVLINATDMSLGERIHLPPGNLFNAICSDLSKFSVARACAASSAVPGVLTPITLKNYAGTLRICPSRLNLMTLIPELPA